jgi:hypothetical protein
MGTKQKKILLKDIPVTVINDALEFVKDYAVSMISINYGESGEIAQFLGSGTFVKHNNHFCILTAGHVIAQKNFKNAEKIGLCFLSDTHKFELERIAVHCKYIWNKTNIKEGPDLGLIVLPESNIGWIKATKSFWNLSAKKEIVLQKSYNNNGAWAVCGVVDKLIESKGPDRGHNKVFRLHHYLWYGGFEGVFKKNGHDYIETSVNYNTNPDLPEDFGGLSGSGLWHVPLFESKWGEIQCGTPILSGVTFYQTETVDGMCHLRSHGRDSIYIKLMESNDQ